jgi:hypothetical protein
LKQEGGISQTANQRDYRLDFFRGLALFFIFIDHIPNNPFAYFTMRGVNLADAAEVFIFISGYTAALVYGNKMRRHGAIFASALIWRRVWQLYVAHLCLFIIYSAEVAYTLRRFHDPLFSDELGIGSFLQQPDVTILRVMLLRFQPALLDILPLYIVLLLVFPLFMVAMRRHILLALIPSALIYAYARLTELNLPGFTDNDWWFFDPFAWQFLFVIAACAGYARAEGRPSFPRSGWLAKGLILWAIAVTVGGMAIQLSWTGHMLNPRIPGILFQTMYPLHKTLLPLSRLFSILALAMLVGRFVPQNARFMTSRAGWLVVLCGQHSLHVFCLSILLSLLGNILITFVSNGFAMLVAINLGGILTMIGLALMISWYREGGHLPVRPRTQIGVG